MEISLVNITMDNFEECINLQVDDSQRGFVANNAYSLSEAFADKVSEPRAIYVDSKMVGFVMYDYDLARKTGFISRLMVDRQYQNNGYGSAAMQKAIQALKEIPECRFIQTSYHKDNDNAGRLYQKLGFALTGEQTSNGEIICKITL